MQTAPRHIEAAQRATLAAARLAYFEGDFEGTLAICRDLPVTSVAGASESALLSARAYLRIGRPADAESVVRESAAAHRSPDAGLTAAVLLGAARIRQGDSDGGLAMLADAESKADEAHFAIRAELIVMKALGYWSKRDIDAAETQLAQVDPRSDIIYARALELQAWCHDARGDHRRAADFFLQTLLKLDECLVQDRAIAATSLCSLSIFAAELCDPNLAFEVDCRTVRMEWSSGLALQHYLTVAYQAHYQEFAGNTVAALELACKAHDMAPTAAYEVFAIGHCAAIARRAGELSCAVVYAKRARELLRSLDVRSLVGEERFSLLVAAENCAYFEVGMATEFFDEYRRLAAPADKMVALAGDPRLAGEELYVAGVLAEARGDMDEARVHYLKTFDIFAPIGYVNRAMIAAFALYRTAGDDRARQYIEAHTAGVTNHITRQLQKRGAGRPASSLREHPIAATLPPVQRDIVALLCTGKTNREIAQIRNVGEQTIKNALTQRIYPAFGVSSRAELLGMCLSFSNREHA